MIEQRLANVLVVEDNDNDLELFKTTIQEGKFLFELFTAKTAGDAISILEKQGKMDLIFLDITLPGVDGFQLLETIKKNKEWQNIPVAILSGTQNEEDLKKSYQLKAGYYITKPIQVGDIVSIITSLKNLNLAITSGERA